MAETPNTRANRPSLGAGMRSSSYVQELSQYRPPQPDGHEGIDSIVERTQNTSITPSPPLKPYNGVPSPHSPPKIVDSGLNHTLTHTNCQAPPGTTSDRVIATILYKNDSPRIFPAPPIDRSPSPSRINTPGTIPPNMAPTRSLSNFPLEPPPPDPEPLDHLYGSYISPLYATYLTLADLRKHELLYRFEREWNVDVVLQVDTVLRRYPQLVVFDMDSTLIEQEVIDLLAASINVQDAVSTITSRAMNGELDFSSSFRERVKLLRGVDADIFSKLQSVITPTKGARELIRALKRIGCKTAVLSGGFIPLTQYLADSLGIDYAYANSLVSDPATNTFTGEVSGSIVNAERKRELLLEIAKKENVHIDQVVAVGDGANDLLMMGAAGLGVAWNAKPVVQMEAQARLNGSSLLELLFIFGFTAEEVQVLIA
ncbi:Phosphoserine phosphatase [Lachnellula hyalina]|uniref:phosphoserine phosphatase n=1 Tax=Lachnellula hyalina TaxID=1316788 RepID=A0A8H8U1H4_9HELO|nr:Phosphoserine phosphatase [Lachnellula hyalina]TVY27937.1 Phosphoserine phosphatase [Lachnellula hyalina]